MSRRRLDRELVSRGLCADLEEARAAVEARLIAIDGAPAMNPAAMVDSISTVTVQSPARFASRAGDKLAGALEDLMVDPAGRRCLDAGAGSGGFTDSLLQRGAASVVAVDVGYGQFDWRLRNDPRVQLLERTNVRALPDIVEGDFELIVADLSFVPLRSVIPTLERLGGSSCDWLMLVKPQFEIDPGDVPRGGVVRDPALWEFALTQAVGAAGSSGLGVAGVSPSRVPGAEGNREFFLHARRDATGGEERAKEALKDLS
ncbi:MAG TPA: TlyA family RNA methyltransferase [Actinomycetota bacterium]|nr:TlyA family RNA methyltransferase [Actinomycetota bacterium]